MNQFYHINFKEIISIYLQGVAVVALFAYFFYRSLWATIFLIPLLFLYRKDAIIQRVSTKREEMRLQFKEVIAIVAGNLQAGYAVENAFLEAEKEMVRMYGQRQSTEAPAIRMLAFLRRGIENNVPLDIRLKEAGKISEITEISEFAEVFAVAKHSGGNMIDSIGQFVVMIGDKIETEKEIKVTLSARRGEQRIMNVVPFAILLYLDVSSPGFFSSLYHNLAGVVIMSACMFVYLTAYLMSRKMLRIEV
jgi:tight adherence protein B